MRLTIDAFKVAAWMLLRDLMETRGLSEKWLREQVGDERATFDSWLRSHENHRVEEYCELILQADRNPPKPRTEPFDAGHVGLFRHEEYRERFSTTTVAEPGDATDTAHASLMLVDLVLAGVVEDVEAKRISADKANAVVRKYFELLSTHTSGS